MTTSTTTDYYAILKVSSTATVDEIQQAYRGRAKECHPDMGGTHEEMVALTEAWETLRDPQKRVAYDRMRGNPSDPTALAKWGDVADAVRASAQKYPRKWDVFQSWLDSAIGDTAFAEYGTVREENDPSDVVLGMLPWRWLPFPTVRNSLVGRLFIVGGVILIVGPLIFLGDRGLLDYHGFVVSTFKQEPFNLFNIFVGIMWTVAPVYAGAWLGRSIHGLLRDVVRIFYRGSGRAQSTSQETRVVQCAMCKQRLRVPALAKRIKVKCPKCANSFDFDAAARFSILKSLLKHLSLLVFSLIALIVISFVAIMGGPDKPDRDGWTPLMRATQSSDFKTTTNLIRKGANVNAKDKNGVTPLFIAAFNNPTAEIVAVLIKSGARVNAKSTPKGWTPLIAAALKNNSTVVEEILKAGADVHVRDGDGLTALMHAAHENQNVDVAKALIKAGADVNAKTKTGVTALLLAGMNNSNPEVTSTLVKAGANVTATDDNGATPLIGAAIGNKNPAVIAALVKAGADVKAKDIDGFTAIMGAAQMSQTPAVITELVKAGADVNANDNKDTMTPLMLAAALNPNPEIIVVLVRSGAKVDAKNNDGRTALDFAVENKNLANVEVLQKVGFRRK